MAVDVTALRVPLEAIWRGKDEVTEAERDLRGLGQAGESGIQGLNNHLEQMAGIAAGVGGAIAVVKQALEFAREGQNLQRLERRFESLTANIGTNASALEDLQRATGGAVSEFELISSANQLMVMGLAQSEEQLVKHFDIVSRLKDPNEDLASALENWALTLANQSLPRLDSFGISSGRVRERINELTTGIDALDRETAFVIATMEEAENSIIAMGEGGELAVNSVDRLTATIQDNKNAFIQWFSQGIMPTLDLFTGGWSQGINAAARQTVEQAESFDELVDAADRLHSPMVTLLGLNRQSRDSTREFAGIQEDLRRKMVLTSNSFEDFATLHYAAFGAEPREELERFYNHVVRVAEAQEAYAIQTQIATERQQAMTDAALEAGVNAQFLDEKMVRLSDTLFTQEERLADNETAIRANTLELMAYGDAVQDGQFLANRFSEHAATEFVPAMRAMNEEIAESPLWLQAFRGEMELSGGAVLTFAQRIDIALDRLRELDNRVNRRYRLQAEFGGGSLEADDQAALDAAKSGGGGSPANTPAPQPTPGVGGGPINIWVPDQETAAMVGDLVANEQQQLTEGAFS